MTFLPQLRIPATYMRGGTSKGVFFRLQDLPEAAQVPGAARDALLMRVIGSPDPYGKQTDGMGGATSSTSKCVIISAASVPDHDVDYLYGQVSIETAFVDWSGNCGNLSTAVGPFAIANGLIDPALVPRDGLCTVRIWQANIKKTIIAHVPMTDGAVQETGDFELDGVTFPAAELRLEFMDPAEDGDGGSMFPTGNLVDDLEVPGVGTFKATMINSGIPTIFLDAEALGYTGTELQDHINGDAAALARFETIRAHGALRMGLIGKLEDAASRQHTPKVAFVARPKAYVSSSGKQIGAGDIDVLVRALSMGKLHHAMMGTASVAIGPAAAGPNPHPPAARPPGRPSTRATRRVPCPRPDPPAPAPAPPAGSSSSRPRSGVGHGNAKQPVQRGQDRFGTGDVLAILVRTAGKLTAYALRQHQLRQRLILFTDLGDHLAARPREANASHIQLCIETIDARQRSLQQQAVPAEEALPGKLPVLELTIEQEQDGFVSCVQTHGVVLIRAGNAMPIRFRC
ncbi:hypothetical protein G6F65_012814 [Rhizopus arrhizus]|nr:hypothetical protein G6F65_012814 [Rhizopus arrhizus]